MLGVCLSGLVWADSFGDFVDSCRGQTSDASHPTYQEYTVEEAPGENDPKFKPFLGNPRNWTAERQGIHEGIVEDYGKRVSALSREIQKASQGKGSVLILTRGNSGSGKTYMLKHASHPLLVGLNLPSLMRQEQFKTASINPDTIKTGLQSRGGESSSQVHEEGSMLVDRVIEQAFSRGDSFIIDKRLGRADQVEKYARQAKEAGYRVVLIDVDAPLTDSSSRIVDRPVGGESPNVQLRAVEQGYHEARENRLEVSQIPLVDDYFVFSSTPADPKSNGLVAWRTRGKSLQVEKPEVWDSITRPSNQDIEYARHMYGDLLDLLSRAYPDEFLRIMYSGADARDLPTGRDALFDRPRQEYLVLPNDLAFLKSYKEWDEYRPQEGDRFIMGIGLGGRKLYELKSIDWERERLTFVSPEGARKTISVKKFQQRPKQAVISGKELQQHAKREGEYAVGGLSQIPYDLQKTQAHGDHERMAHTIKTYLERTIPGVEVRVEPHKTRGFRVFIGKTDQDTKARLVRDRNWAVKLVAGSDPKDPLLMIDTLDVERQNYGLRDPKFDRGIGYNGVEKVTPGSAGHEFVTYSYQLDYLADLSGQSGRKIFPDAPMLFHVFRRRGLFVFSRWQESAKYSSVGFRSDQGHAFNHSALVELHEARKALSKYQSSSSPEERKKAIDFAKTAYQNAQLSMEFTAFANFPLQELLKIPDGPIPLQRRNAAAPTEMDLEIFRKFPFGIRFHSRQLGQRNPGLPEDKIRSEFEKAVKWFEKIQERNRMIHEETEAILKGLGAGSEIKALEEQWEKDRRFPDLSGFWE